MHFTYAISHLFLLMVTQCLSMEDGIYLQKQRCPSACSVHSTAVSVASVRDLQRAPQTGHCSHEHTRVPGAVPAATATPPALRRTHCTVSCRRSLLACTFLGGRNNTPLREALEMVPMQGLRQTAEQAPPSQTEQTSRSKPGLVVQRGAFCHQTQAAAPH